MAADKSSSGRDAETLAQGAADRLALALEEIGFDVGVSFPGLHGAPNKSGTPTVYLGTVTADVASDLSDFLTDAVHRGAALPPR
jgi:hypothetical protein